ncbi:ABC transporter permease [Qipengyuania sediminis]|uniref:ABC transporter permease n=1 Tax=Qipengyuania sediminis TaxID=1532023 RepID=UPI0010596A4A|nr:ABC transporter permease [Qipengyuania sediminis]
MAEQSHTIKAGGGAARAFAPPGRPVITGINRVGLWSLYVKEVRRFFKVQTQTIWAPAVTTLLFLVIFTVALGPAKGEVLGMPFGDFVAPGLIVMGMMQNAFANSSFSFLSGKIQGTIIDLLMPPLSEGELMTGIVAAAITRAVLVGLTVAVAMALYPGVTLHAREPWAIVWFGLMGATLLALTGLVASIWAEKFDHNAAVTNFVVAPLSLLSGTFYTIERLPGVFHTISLANPFFYVISGFRYGFIGRSDMGGEDMVLAAALGLLVLNAVLGFATYRLLRSGWKIRS